MTDAVSPAVGGDGASGASAELFGRDPEVARLKALIAGARGGTSGVLVVTGPAGVGKTSLLHAAFPDPPGFATVWIEGVEPEAGLAYSALHRLLAPFLPPAQPLAEPQQQALDCVFGVRLGDAPDPFLVGLATLTALTDVARRRPLVCVIDDVHWIDEPSLLVLAFVARRLLADPIVLVFALRPEPRALGYLNGLPDLVLDGLDHDAQLALLHRCAPAIRPAIARRIAAEGAGNPLALVEFARGLSPHELSGAAHLADVLPLTADTDHLFDRDIRALPDGARLLLTTAALEPSGDAELIRRSAQAAGADLTDDPEPHLGRLASIREHVTFAHPLVRSAAYRSATAEERRRIHAALADAGSEGDPVRRAWHLARAADAPDDAIADQLESAAVAARTRGGHSAESELLLRAAELTTDAARRNDLVLRSATAAALAGQYTRALTLVPEHLFTQDPVVAAKAALVRAKAKVATGNFFDAPDELAVTARALRGADDAAARDAWQHALDAAYIIDGPDRPRRFDRIAAAAAASGLAPGPARTFIDLLAVGLVAVRAGDRAAGIAILREAYGRADIETPNAMFGIEGAFCGLAGIESYDLAAAGRALERLDDRDRRAGALPNLRVTKLAQATFAALTGRLAEAHQLFSESQELHLAYGGDPRWDHAVLWGLALSGREAECGQEYARLVPQARELGLGSLVADACAAVAELLVGRGLYADAVAEVRELFAADSIGAGTLLLPTLVESAVRSGDGELAEAALDRLWTRAAAADTPWARGLLARSRALVAAPGEAEALYAEALSCLAIARMPLDLARAQLLYGEWLRRQRRRTDAVERLGQAQEAFATMGAAAFAERARVELRAAGGRPRRRAPETRDELTAQERQVARGAASGATNREIAASMFISEATVAYHLRKVFQKLDVSSRRQLRDVDLTR